MNDTLNSAFMDDPDFQSLMVDCMEALQSGKTIDRDALRKKFPKYADDLDQYLDVLNVLDHFAGGLQPLKSSGDPVSPYGATVTPHTGNRDVESGDTIRYIGEFEVLEEIARGGMGVVFKARQQTLKRIVALKMILSGRLADTAEVDRFRREAQAASRLQHPNIVPVHEVGEHEGRQYFTMDYVDGHSLGDEIREESLAPKRAALLVKTVAEAVHFAHEKGTLHRDLKPANVLVTSDDVPHVTDFGLAKFLDDVDDESRAELTASGQILGTPSYMSPEQAAGKQNLVGPASDIYALGAILYACLTGRAPFVADSPVDTLMQVIHKEPVSLRQLNPAVPQDLETICLKCLNKESHKRYGTAQELADDLGRFLESRPVHARPIGRTAKLWRWAYRNQIVASLIGTVFLVLVAGILVSTRYALESQKRQIEIQEKANQLQIAKDAVDEKVIELDAANRKLADAIVRADQEATIATKRLYRVHLSAALREWEIGDVQLAWQNLRDCPERYRGWEYDYAHALFTERQQTYEDPQVAGISCGVYSPDGKMIALGDHEQQILLWDGTGKPQLIHKTNDIALQSIAFNRDGTLLYSLGRNELNVFDVPTKKLVKTLARPKTRIINIIPASAPRWDLSYAELSHDATRLVAKNRKNELCIWDTDTGKQLQILKDAPGWPQCFAFSPDSRLVAAGNRNGELFLWETDSGNAVGQIQAHDQKISSLAFSWDGQLLVSGGWDNVAKVWDVETQSLLQTLSEHSRGVTCVAFSRDDRRVVTGSYDNLLKVWDIEEGRVLETLKGHKEPALWVSWSPHANRFLSGRECLKIWDLDGDEIETSFKLATNFSNEVSFSQNHKTLLYGKQNTEIALFDWNTSEQVSVFPSHTLVRFGRTVKTGTNALAFSHNGELAASASPSMIRIDETTTGDNRHSISSRQAGAQCLDFSPDDQVLASGSRNNPGKVDLWDVQTGEHITAFQFGDERFRSLAFSPDQRFLAGSSFDDLVVWDLSTNSMHCDYSRVGNLTANIEFSPDGSQLISGHGDNLARVWKVDEDRLVFALKGHTNTVTAVNFGPEGKRILTGGADGMVKLWDAQNGELLMALKGQQRGVVRVGFSPDRNTLFSAGQDGRVITWTLNSKKQYSEKHTQ